MPTSDDVRRLALSLPEAVEGDDHGKPAFLVSKKIFCTLGEETAVVRLSSEDQHNLAEPGVVEPIAGYWGRKGWTQVRFAAADAVRLELLLRLAWDGVAPRRIPRPG